MQAQKYSIKSWAKDDRPREKLLHKGAETLSDSELLAILIGSGTPQHSALDLARLLLQGAQNSLSGLARQSATELMRVPGIGSARAVTLAAALELGRRCQAGSLFEKPTVTSSQDVALQLKALLQDYRHEVFAVLYLNRANRVNRFEIVSEGGITGTVADPRIILRRALEEDAVGLILCHNHPSGNLRPSRADEELTVKIREAARFFDIRLLDHLIVSTDGYFSFADEGLL
ncbi:RadC family protein [Flaviaesturariibacter aridisoli]|uniref:JAB domain-containing protein n=1 Tax=Flaviaesturariibacter aridisoli TaxID=2545761 RepID=A0A4R4E863_9BACT|nr:DNA repair protein RadC [Flaviaesturariibacter aridisoli]TCZ75030.1 JAB domain-containing protein [Flaviaesturariibacter aridisoli]